MKNIAPPKAEKRRYTHKLHGIDREDPYYWLRDDSRDSPQVLAYLERENEYTDSVLAPIAGPLERLCEEMCARLPTSEDSLPYWFEGYWYQLHYPKGCEHPVILRYRENEDSHKETLLDANKRAQNKKYYALVNYRVSRDGRYLAFTEDVIGRYEYTLYIIDLKHNRLLESSVELVGMFAWANDSQTLYYTAVDKQTLLPSRVFRRTVGEEAVSDELVYEEHDRARYVSVFLTTSKQFIVIGSCATHSSECYYIDANDIKGKPRCFLKRNSNHEYYIDHINSRFYVRTNYRHQDFAIYSVDDHAIGGVDDWNDEFIPEEDEFVEGFGLFADYFVVESSYQGLVQIKYRPWDSRNLKAIIFDDPTYCAWLGYPQNTNTSKLRYCYNSLTTPLTDFEIDLATGDQTVLRSQKVLGGFKSTDYRSERIWTTARDGERVPVSIVYRRDCFQCDGANPLVVFGYGSYGHNTNAEFEAKNVSLLDRGIVCAYAHIRGGEEMGREWYEGGKLLNKKNTFNDFEDVTRDLVRRGYGDSENVFAIGRSAGGLLIGALVNQAPALFKGVIAAVPFVDIVTTMLDDTIPLTTREYDEWGDPNDERFFKYMLSYSPYDQTKQQPYPHMLVTTGLHDGMVQYWEPAKWVAKLRDVKTDDNHLLLRVDMDAGHAGKVGRFSRYREIALHYGFILWIANKLD